MRRDVENCPYGHVWTPPLMQEESFERVLSARSGADMCPASDAAVMCRRPVWEFAERVQFSDARSKALVHNLVFPIPYLTEAPYSPFDLLTS